MTQEEKKALLDDRLEPVQNYATSQDQQINRLVSDSGNSKSPSLYLNLN